VGSGWLTAMAWVSFLLLVALPHFQLFRLPVSGWVHPDRPGLTV